MSHILSAGDLLRGVVIEGTVCAGKSTLLRALLAHPSYVNRPGLSSLVLTEHHTQRVLEGRGARASLTPADHMALLCDHLDYVAGLHARLSAMRAWRSERRQNPRLGVVLERFHLTHALAYEHLGWEHVEGVDARLAELGFALCLIVASPAELRRRLSEERGAAWTAFLTEPGTRDHLPPGSSWEARIDALLRQQDGYRALAARSRLPVLEIDTSHAAPADSAAAILERLLGEPRSGAPPTPPAPA
jgi:hypothetical protein